MYEYNSRFNGLLYSIITSTEIPNYLIKTIIKMAYKGKLNKYQKEALFMNGYFNPHTNTDMNKKKDFDFIQYIARRLQRLAENNHLQKCGRCGKQDELIEGLCYGCDCVVRN